MRASNGTAPSGNGLWRDALRTGSHADTILTSINEPAAGFTRPIMQAGADVARAVGANVLFAYASAVDDPATLAGMIHKPTQLVLVARDAEEEAKARAAAPHVLNVPSFDLTRMAQIKMATLLAFSQGLLKAGDVFVFLSGAAGATVDTLVAMRVGAEYELFQSVGQPRLTEHIRRAVFEKVLRLALELAHQGREGKPVGTLFVIGDHREVQKYVTPGRINPFRGYAEKERNILDDSMNDTVKEVAKMDGAFVIKGNGVIMTACATLRATMAGQELPQGLGSRHAAAAAITACTRSIAITLSESTGDVRVWRRGAMVTEIEKSPRSVLDGRAGA